MMNKITKENLHDAMKQLLTIASFETNIALEDFLKDTRKRKIVDVRRIVYKIVIDYKDSNVSLSDIADYFGQSHCTALYSKKTADNLLRTDKSFEKLFLILENSLESILYTSDSFYEISGLVPCVNRRAFFLGY